MKSYPTAWQRKVLWSALTALAIAFLAALSIAVIYRVGEVLAFLQPLLIPVAVAGILSYLLEPVVEKLTGFGVRRTKAVLYVFALILVPFVGICFWVVPEIAPKPPVRPRRSQLYRREPRLDNENHQVLAGALWGCSVYPGGGRLPPAVAPEPAGQNMGIPQP